MKIILKKKIWVPDGNDSAAVTHAMNPTADLIDDNTIRVYFSCLDAEGTGRIFYIDIDAADPSIIKATAQLPVLDIGINGMFDDSGMVPSSVIDHNGKKMLYYYGFQKGVKIRFSIFTGLALSADNGNNWERYSRVPILDRCEEDIYMRSLPHVLKEEDRLRLWYSGVNRWVTINGKELPFGEIKYAESNDGIHFGRSVLCLSPLDDEFSLSRAFVFRNAEKYNMLFSRRMKTDIYKIGYASSVDGISWQRNDDKVEIEGEREDWNSEMLCYTSLVKAGNKTWLFYNGNDFGKTGFGYAEVTDI